MKTKLTKKVPAHQRNGKHSNQWGELAQMGTYHQTLAKEMNAQAIVSVKAVQELVTCHIAEPLNDFTNEQASALIQRAKVLSDDMSTYVNDVVTVAGRHKDKTGGVRSESQQLEVLGIATQYDTLTNDAIAIASENMMDIVAEIVRVDEANPGRKLDPVESLKTVQANMAKLKENKKTQR